MQNDKIDESPQSVSRSRYSDVGCEPSAVVSTGKGLFTSDISVEILFDSRMGWAAPPKSSRARHGSYDFEKISASSIFFLSEDDIEYRIQ